MRRVEMTNFLPHTRAPGQTVLGSVTTSVKARRKEVPKFSRVCEAEGEQGWWTPA